MNVDTTYEIVEDVPPRRTRFQVINGFLELDETPGLSAKPHPFAVSNSQWLDGSRVPSAHRFDRAVATERLASARLRIETDNHVRRLCERVGFKTIGGVGGSLTVLLRLCDA
jgi:hypothetical protein